MDYFLNSNPDDNYNLKQNASYSLFQKIAFNLKHYSVKR